MSIKIIIDSSSDINAVEAEKIGIVMIPMEVRIGQQLYWDGVNLMNEQFYDLLIHGCEIPKTSQINPYRFEQVFEEVIQQGHEAIVITISSKLSGTNLSALTAAKKFENKIHVVDSLNASVGERLLVQLALQLIDKGLSCSEIVKELEIAKKKIKFIARLDTLKYLKKGGRISSIAAIGGEILAIKPVIGVIGGEVKLLGKARGSKNGNNLLTKMIQEEGGIDFAMPYGTVYSGLSDEFLKQYILDFKDIYHNEVNSIPIYQLGCTIGTHIGPNGIGVAYFAKE